MCVNMLTYSQKSALVCCLKAKLGTSNFFERFCLFFLLIEFLVEFLKSLPVLNFTLWKKL